MFLLSLPRGGESTTRDKERNLLYTYSTYSTYTIHAQPKGGPPRRAGRRRKMYRRTRRARLFESERVKKTMSSKGEKESKKKGDEKSKE